MESLVLSEQNQAENNILIKELEKNHKPTNTGMASKQYFFLQQYYNTSKNILPCSNNILQYLQKYSIIYLQKYFYHTFHRLYWHSSQIKIIGFSWKWIYLLKENRKEL